MIFQQSFSERRSIERAQYVWARAAHKYFLVSAERERTQNYWARAQISAHFCAQNGVIFDNIRDGKSL